MNIGTCIFMHMDSLHTSRYLGYSPTQVWCYAAPLYQLDEMTNLLLQTIHLRKSILGLYTLRLPGICWIHGKLEFYVHFCMMLCFYLRFWIILLTIIPLRKNCRVVRLTVVSIWLRAAAKLWEIWWNLIIQSDSIWFWWKREMNLPLD